MQLSELEEKMHAFVSSKGWYEPGSAKPQSPRNLAISLVIEAAEVLEHFQWRDDVVDSVEFADELADVGLYLIQLASITGVNLEEAIIEKLAKNQNRHWPDP